MVSGSGEFVSSRQVDIDLFEGDFKDANAARYKRIPD